MARSFDDATEAALVQRASRDGYDLRTIDRLVVSALPTGTAYFASVALDTHRVVDRLWERLLEPRRRTRDGAIERVEGYRGREMLGLMVDPLCRTAAYVEGSDTRQLDRLLATPSDAPDPDALVVWRATQLPSAFPPQADAALIRQVSTLELGIRRASTGLDTTLRLEGSFTDDSARRVQAALNAVVRSPLGELAGAIQWLDPTRVVEFAQASRITIHVVVPWRAATALADALHGRVGDGPLRPE